MELALTGTARPPVDRIGPEAARAESKGYNALLYADHMMGWFPDSLWNARYTPAVASRRSPHDYVDPTCAVAIASAASSTLRLGFGVTDLLRWHPAVVARTALTLDHMTQGRFILGLGAGEAENLIPYGVANQSAVDALEEGLEIIRALWESEGPVSLSGSRWGLSNAVLGMSPLVAGRLPAIWLAARGPRMRRLTARHADGWLPMFIGPKEFEDSRREILSLRNLHGRSGRFETAIYSFVAIGDSKDHCRRLFESPLYRCLGLLLPASSYESHGLEHPLGAGRYGLIDFIPSNWSEADALDVLERVPPEMVGEAVLHGSVDDVRDELMAYASAGCDLAVLGNVSFLTDSSLVRSSYAALDSLVEVINRSGRRASEGTD